MNSVTVFPIGKIENNEHNVRVVLDKAYAPGLDGLDRFSHVQILWWASDCGSPADRSTVSERKPYKRGPDTLGVFALRSPERPNPIAVSNAKIAYADIDSGILGLDFIDAFDGTPVLDLKPYTPSIDRVETAQTPDWCRHWPKSFEESGSFDWAAEFNFAEDFNGAF